MNDILERDGLSVELLSSLSYKSELGISLNFDRDLLLAELFAARRWFNSVAILPSLPVDYRIKSKQSIVLKFDRYWPDHQARKVFNDLLGFRSMCDSYDCLESLDSGQFKFVDISHGKSNDDGYRGVHIYYVDEPRCYPIEIQYNTFFDRQLNNWLHKYVYKLYADCTIGAELRSLYEVGKIRSESEFLEELDHVLSSREVVF